MRLIWRDTALAVGLAGCVAGCADRGRKDDSGDVAIAPPATTEALGRESAIVLDSATISRIGLRTEALARSVRAPEIQLPAQVVDDPGAATTVRSGVGGRLTEVAGRAWPGVGERLRAGEEIAQVGDARPVVVPRAGTVMRLLAQPGELVQSGQPLLELRDFSSSLVRVAGDESGVPPPARLTLSALSGGGRLAGRLLGQAPEADPVTHGPAWLYRVAGDRPLRPGEALLAYLPDRRGTGGGVLMPADAAVQWDALAWAFVERTPGHFVRVRVPTDRPVAGGWLVSEGFAPGDRVVVTGAGQLLSEEFRARITVGQEVGE